VVKREDQALRPIEIAASKMLTPLRAQERRGEGGKKKKKEPAKYPAVLVSKKEGIRSFTAINTLPSQGKKSNDPLRNEREGGRGTLACSYKQSSSGEAHTPDAYLEKNRKWRSKTGRGGKRGDHSFLVLIY